jgi:hypothetical protein
MSKKKGLIRNVLVLGIIILLMGIAVQPGTATLQTEEADIDPKDTLFQTIIDIANNQEVKNLFEKEKNNGFFFDFDYNINVYTNILLKNPDLLNLLFLTKTSFTHRNLEFAYEKGYEIINEIGEDKAAEIVESITITNPRIFNELSNIFENNEEINNKISEIKVINEESNSALLFNGTPIICGILLMLTFTFAIPMVSICVIILTLSSRPILGPFFVGLLGLFSANLALFFTLVKTFC